MARAAAMLVLVAAMAALPSAGSQARQGDGELHLTTENYPRSTCMIPRTA